MGSGKRFKNSLYYHGKGNFKREILEYFDDSKSMYDREREIVNEEFLKNSQCLNLTVGGKGGFNNTKHQMKCSKAGNIAFKIKLKSDNELLMKFQKIGSENFKLAHKLNKIKIIQQIRNQT